MPTHKNSYSVENHCIWWYSSVYKTTVTYSMYYLELFELCMYYYVLFELDQSVMVNQSNSKLGRYIEESKI